MQLRPAAPKPEHVATFYRADEFIVNRIAGFVADGLRARERVIVIATAPHWQAVSAHLDANAVAHGRAMGEGRLVLIPADELVETLTIDGGVDVGRFRDVLAPLAKAPTRTRMYGELVSLLVERGDVEAALAIERLGHELARALNVAVLCGYHLEGAHRPTPADIARIQELHDRTELESVLDAADDAGRSPELRQLHAVRFYESRESLARIVAEFLGTGFVAGLPAVVIATREHCDAIKQALSARFFDVPRLEAAGDLITADAAAVLSQFMVDGAPDPGNFRAAVVPLLERAARGRADCVVRAYGEMVDLLWKEGQTVAAVRLEALWNQLAHTHAFALLCGYSMGHFYKAAGHDVICAAHSHILQDDGGVPGVH